MAEKKVRKKTTRKTTARKAPSRASVKAVSTQKKSIALYVAVGVFIIFIGVSFVIGSSGKGQIDVSNAIAEKIQNAEPEERERIKNIPVQQARNNVPDGGLVPTTDIDPDIKEEIPNEETGTSTDDIATSTEDVVDELLDDSEQDDSVSEEVTEE